MHPYYLENRQTFKKDTESFLTLISEELETATGQNYPQLMAHPRLVNRLPEKKDAKNAAYAAENPGSKDPCSLALSQSAPRRFLKIMAVSCFPNK